MKQCYIFIFLIICSLSSLAQIKRDQFLLGGTGRFESKNEDYSANGTVNIYKSSTMSIAPDFGYFVIDNLAAGLRFGFSSFKNKTSNYLVTTSGIEPFIRYYVLPAERKVNAFLDVSYIGQYQRYKNLNSSSSFTTNTKTNGYAVSGGPAIFLSKQVALEFVFGYRHQQSKEIGTIKSGLVFSALGLQFYFGNPYSKQKKVSS